MSRDSRLADACAIGGVDDGTLRVCCSAHGRTLCAHHYARAHFVETADEWATEFACDRLTGPYYADEQVTLHHGDALEVLGEWDADSVDAIVTSPEYADQRKYNHGSGRSPETYADKLAPFLAEMLRVLRPAGSLMLNLGVIMRDGEEHPYADEVLGRARSMGWKLLHRMVWQKSNPLPLSHPPYLTVAHEWVFWLAPTIDAYRGYDADTRTPHAAASVRRIGQPYLRSKDERYARRGKSNELHPDGAKPTTVYTCAVGSTRGIKHPAPMAMPLAKQLVSLSCPRGGLVLDPFVGSGTTCLAARERSRRSVGIDLSDEYLSEAVERLADFQPSLTFDGGAS